MDYFSFFSFGIEVKATEILKYILSFTWKKYGQWWGTNYQVLGKC